MAIDDWGDGYPPEDFITPEYYQLKNEYKRSKLMRKKVNNSLPKNRFYVASGNVIDGHSNSQWKKKTLEEATNHGKNLMEAQDLDEIYIVKVVRVIRRAPQPVQLFDLK